MDQRTQGRGSIDLVLEDSLAAWRSLPDVEREIDSWDPDEAAEFLSCWPVQEVRLGRLNDEADEDAMTDGQLRRYEELLEVVARNRPIIERLLET